MVGERERCWRNEWRELVDENQDQWDKEKVVLILDEACSDGGRQSHCEDVGQTIYANHKS